MKKTFITLFLIFILAFVITGCGNKNTETNEGPNDNDSVQTSVIIKDGTE